MQLSRWLVGVIGLLLVGCASVPQSTSSLKGAADYTLLTADMQFVHRQGRMLVSDVILLNYVNSILSRLEQAHGEPCECQVVVDSSSGYESYTVSSQTIVLSAGLIAQADTEDELAAAIAHELSHALSGDLIKYAFQDTLMSAVRIGGVAVASKYGVLLNDKEQESTKSIVYRPWEESQEKQADEFAVHLLAKAGYSQQGINVFVSRLSDYSNSVLAKYNPNAAETNKKCVNNKGKLRVLDYKNCINNIKDFTGNNESIYPYSGVRLVALAELSTSVDPKNKRSSPQAAKLPRFETVDYLYGLKSLKAQTEAELKRAVQQVESKSIPASLLRNAYAYNELAVAHGLLNNTSEMQHYFQQAVRSDYRTSFNYRYLLSFARADAPTVII